MVESNHPALEHGFDDLWPLLRNRSAVEHSDQEMAFDFADGLGGDGRDLGPLGDGRPGRWEMKSKSPRSACRRWGCSGALVAEREYLLPRQEGVSGIGVVFGRFVDRGSFGAV